MKIEKCRFGEGVWARDERIAVLEAFIAKIAAQDSGALGAAAAEIQSTITRMAVVRADQLAVEARRLLEGPS